MSVDVAALYEEGLSIRAVAARTGRSFEYTRLRLIAAGVEPRRQAAATEPDPAAQDFARLYGDGLGLNAVVEVTGHSYRYVRRQLLLAGVQLRPRGGQPVEADPVAEYLAGLYRRGLSLRAIRARTGYGYGFIRTRLLTAGVELRDQHGRPRKAVA
ncbi:helix-turn-helix domain-containing protein [Streptomyces sp900129855]|uniref:Helix-turn-helix domain-containing protein n=1 Tax=Streptomyces sp. 900129855 TaxID=3155129 RepID=A0ABV2ZRN0_9ACTN